MDKGERDRIVGKLGEMKRGKWKASELMGIRENLILHLVSREVWSRKKGVNSLWGIDDILNNTISG